MSLQLEGRLPLTQRSLTVSYGPHAIKGGVYIFLLQRNLTQPKTQVSAFVVSTLGFFSEDSVTMESRLSFFLLNEQINLMLIHKVMVFIS